MPATVLVRLLIQPCLSLLMRVTATLFTLQATVDVLLGGHNTVDFGLLELFEPDHPTSKVG
jgi:hypothetical protein